MISRKPKLKRQRKIFKQEVKNFPRANQMNINIATWGRLLKRSSPNTIEQQMPRASTNHLQISSPLPYQTPNTMDDKFESPGDYSEPSSSGLSVQRPLGLTCGSDKATNTPPPLPKTAPPALHKKHSATRLDSEVIFIISYNTKKLNIRSCYTRVFCTNSYYEIIINFSKKK